MAYILEKSFPVEAGAYTTAGEASTTIKRTLKQLGISAEVLRHVSVACYEVELNLVIHSLGGTLTLLVDPDVPIAEEIRSGKLQLLSPEEVMAETLLMLENTNVSKTCVFRSNHASNYLSLRGNLPQDRERMMQQIRRAMQDSGMLKDERFRAL